MKRKSIPATVHSLLLPLATAASLVACGTPGPLPALEQARSAVNAASVNPDVARHAQLELKAATDTIARADHVWQKDGDEDETRHLAYLATQRAHTAEEIGKARATQDAIVQARSEADRLRLQARTRQLENAQGRAAEAQARADAAQAAAKSARDEAKSAQDAANAARSENLNLQNRLRELEAQQTERGLLVTLGDVLFEFGKSDLLPSATPRMDKLAAFLQQFPDRQLRIEGYTDSVGSVAANQRLSERRAAAVQSALISRGVSPQRIATQGYGKSYPIASNANPEGRALNRRVEVVIADENGNLRSR